MLQPLDREKTFLDKFLTLPVTPRIQRMKDQFFNRKLTATIDRDLIDTRVMKETEGEPMVTRKAKVFSAVVRELPIHILPDELLVGWLDPLPDSCPLGGKQLKNLEELLDDDGENSFGKRKWSPIVISDEQKALLREEVIPYWRGNGKWERIRYSSVHDIRLPPKAFEYTGPPDPEDLSSKMGNISPAPTSVTRSATPRWPWRKDSLALRSTPRSGYSGSIFRIPRISKSFPSSRVWPWPWKPLQSLAHDLRT